MIHARWKAIVIAALALVLSGCDKLSATLTPAAERITKAFPLADDVALATSRFIESAAREGGQAAAKDRIERMMQVRALACTSAISIGRFDSPEDIRRKPVDADCLRKQDADIGEWIGFQRIAALLLKPPLAPLAELGALRTLPSYEETTIGIITSAQSSVALLQGSQGGITAVRLPDGKAFQTIRGMRFNQNAIALSPNGRVMIAQADTGRSIKAYDIESGALVWSSDQYRSLVSWLPESGALVMTRGGTESGTVLLNLVTGKSTPYTAAIRSPSWAIAVPGGPDRRLVGGDSGVALMDHIKEAADGGILATQVQFWPTTRPVSSGRPFLMNNGTKLVYVSYPGLGWLDLATGQSGYVDMGPLRAGNYAQISDTALLYTTPKPGASYQGEGRVLDVERMTVAPVLNYEHNLGSILPLSPRVGFMRRGNFVSVGSKVEVGESTDLQQAIAAANLEVQLAKLQQAQTRQEGPGPAAMLTHVPPNAQVDAIGVYESKAGVHGAGAGRTAGPVRVTVMPSSTPLVLVLASYEPVRWMIENPGNRKISAVLVSGYHDSTVFGAGGAQVLKIGAGYAYKIDSPEYRELKASVARYVSNPIRIFQGTYSGQTFTVTAS
ncbi:WD40 repeat domain-containing protein [Variovorax sp. J22R24]|uniref:WD40 repeat domain-containing protein n=1 Tax=Variovorax gracilis TaxID=3053502 RepID=UPI002574EF54|nr:WD40 repeat domain-containing protein [Variovorax sp. J22R24]MDM0109694.1 WD40 repeat domain-containing protein [Variovorax sp. J22R24]